MRPASVSYAVILAGVLGAACSPAATTSSDGPLAGSWRVLDVTSIDTAGKEGATLPAKGLLLVSGSHYSLTWSDTTGKPAAFANPWVGTDSEKIARFSAFLANAGTFELSHDTMTIHPSSAKVPSYEGGKGGYLWAVKGDTLSLTFFDIESSNGTGLPDYKAGAKERQRFLRLK
jgi:hypothetical protein